jgi:methylthioribose-1-phosphate isomerase
MSEIRAVGWYKGKVRLIDQTRLPNELVYLEYIDWWDVAQAIRDMRVRGAPALGVATALGVALGAKASQARTYQEMVREVASIADVFINTRPTAVNISWAANCMVGILQANKDKKVSQIKKILIGEALRIADDSKSKDIEIGRLGAGLIGNRARILTHCNAGALATGGYGTALGVIKFAFHQGKDLEVFVCETRPRLQGARLTTWELKLVKIPFTLITDSMAGHFMRKKAVDMIIVGADRIASNGDIANKIGTYALAVLAKENSIPFYVAAPTSTIDLGLPSGDEIPIEERDPKEVMEIFGHRVVPEGTKVANPAFDITPNNFITAIITERGVAKSPYVESLKKLLEEGVKHLNSGQASDWRMNR